MAWQARVSDDIQTSPDNRLTIAIEFFDDTDPNTVLHARTWTLAIGTTIAQLQAEVIREGQAARLAFTTMQSARVSVPKGATVAIP